MTILQSHHSSGTSVISQEIALEVLRRDYSSQLLQKLQENRTALFELASTIPLARVTQTQGSYYSFWDVRETFGKKTPAGKLISDSEDLAHYLVDEFGVVTAPGKSFGIDGYLRLSFAVPHDCIAPGMEAARQAFAALRD